MSRERFPRPLARAVAVVAMAIVLIAAAVLFRQWSASSLPAQAISRPHAAPRVLATLPPFVLEDQHGRPFGLDDLRGRVFVADFIFTRCAGTCPMITHRMKALQAELAADPALAEVGLLSISVDPEFDTPAVLDGYARAHDADPRRWVFLTGTRSGVRGLVREGFKLPIEDQDDKVMPIVHSQHFVLIDRAGRIRGLFDALDDAGIQELRHALARLLAEPRATDLVFPADAADPRWTRLRLDEQTAAEASIAAPHRFRFADRIGSSGIGFVNVASPDLGKYYRPSHYDHGTAVAAADVDGDGRPDLYFVNQAGRNGLWMNRGGGRFEDGTAAAGVGVGDRACVGAAFADVDNDGDPDLFVSAIREGNLLFRNDGGGKFTDVTRESGLGGDDEHASGAVFFDADGDGRLDLFVTHVGRYTGSERRADGLWVSFTDAFAGHLHPDRAEASVLYRNAGACRFERVPDSSGLVHHGWSGDATPFDAEGDGRPGLYVVSMQGHDESWRNLGGGHFAARGADLFPDSPWGSMGVKALDWNADGRLDLFVTDMHTDMAGELRPEDERRKHDPATMFPPRFLGTDGRHILGNALYTNQGGGRFTDESDAANVETGWPWGPSAGDLNADGYPDLFVAAGMNFPHRYHGNDLLLNEGGRRFANAEFLLGVEPRGRRVRPWFTLDCDGEDRDHALCRGETPAPGFDAPGGAPRGPTTALHGAVTVWAARASRSSVILDLDGDGDLDIVTNDYGDEPQILTSDLAESGAVHFVVVRLVGKRSNRDGLGATVTLRAGGRAQLQVHDGKSGYLGQSALPLYFGLGDAKRAESITVRWPGGSTQTVRGPIRSGATVVVEER